MADEAHLAVLKQGADVWNRWRAAHPDIRPDLSNAILRGLDLVKVDLSRADLSGTDLRGTVLSGAVLVDADLSGAKFFNCAQLIAARNWQTVARDSNLACGAPIPPIPDRL